MNPAPAILRLRSLTLAHGTHRVIRQVSGAFEAGSSTALVGANGAGKSSLLRAIAGELPPAEGDIELDRTRIRVAWLPQRCDIDRQFPITVREFVALGAWQRTGAHATFRDPWSLAVREALAEVAIDSLADRLIGSLSGGEFQRALFAGVMVADADLVLLDEPLNSMDQVTAHSLAAILANWRTQGRTVIAALHDLAFARAQFRDYLALTPAGARWGRSSEITAFADVQAGPH